MILTVFLGTASATQEFTDDVKVKVAMLIDADSGEVLFETDNIDKQIRPASTTKIMTCILALENADLTDEVKISSNAGGLRGSTLGITTGETIVMKDLLTGMMVASGNDAAVAVAEHVADSVDAFVVMMNQKAEELGMTNTVFTNPHGLDKEEPLVTVRDMAKLAQHAFANPVFREIVETETFDMPMEDAKTIKNTNHLIRKDEEDDYYPYANGMKTGATPEAGRCIVASATKDGMNLICLLFGDPDENGPNRWPLAKKLFDHGFNNYATSDLASLLVNVDPVQVQVQDYAINDESSGLLEFEADDFSDIYVTLDKDVMSKILDGTYTVSANKTFGSDILAPVEQGEMLGTVTYTCDDTEDVLYSGNLIAPRAVAVSGMEPDASGNTAVETMPPTVPEEIVTAGDNKLIWIWLIIPVGLVVFLVIRLITVNKRKRRRFKRRRPHYSYRIK